MHNLLNWPKAGLLIASITAFTCQATSQSNCRDDVIPSTPSSRFTVHDDGTVTDMQTGLIWQRCSLGQHWDGSTCTGDAAAYIWQGALTAAENNEFAGKRDWVLPNIKQLTSIAELACLGPAINSSVFPNTPSNWFWTSSPHPYSNAGAWYVEFGAGNESTVGKSDGLLHVRLVRGGQ